MPFVKYLLYVFLPQKMNAEISEGKEEVVSSGRVSYGTGEGGFPFCSQHSLSFLNKPVFSQIFFVCNQLGDLFHCISRWTVHVSEKLCMNQDIPKQFFDLCDYQLVEN
jgi:hypothetical protein